MLLKVCKNLTPWWLNCLLRFLIWNNLFNLTTIKSSLVILFKFTMLPSRSMLWDMKLRWETKGERVVKWKSMWWCFTIKGLCNLSVPLKEFIANCHYTAVAIWVMHIIMFGIWKRLFCRKMKSSSCICKMNG